MNVFVLNSGSSSLKAAVVHAETGYTSWHGDVEKLGSDAPTVHWNRAGEPRRDAALPSGSGHPEAVAALLQRLQDDGARDGLAGVGHRIVHGGERFSASVLLDDAVVQAIAEHNHLAPLHNPANLLGVAAARAAFPDLPHVGVFDTAFHASMPRHTYLYGVPHELYEQHGVRRYGFHGSSHRFVSAEATRRLGDPAACVITAHLGNGSSVAAVNAGRSVDTSMGMTPLEGLVMGTRSGDVDPGLHAFLCDRLGLDAAGVTNVLNKQSGLLGLSGLSNDMRTLLEAEEQGHERAGLAIDVFCYRLARTVAALTAALPRLDALVFTGGIGEHAAPVRARALGHLGVLGFELDPEANAAHGGPTGRITTAASRKALVVPTDEERIIAQDTAALAAGAAP